MKDEIEDAIVNAEREIQSSSPSSGRVGRLLMALVTKAEQLGIGVVSSLLADQIKRIGM
jgi:hypothetical protein